jgi:hypothetical protein
MSNEMTGMGDIFAQMESEALAAAQLERAAEDAAWAALPPEEKASRIEAMEARWAAPDAEPDEDEDEPDEDEDEPEEE